MRHSVAAAKGILECSVKDILVSGQGVRPAVFAKYSAIGTGPVVCNINKIGSIRLKCGLK